MADKQVVRVAVHANAGFANDLQRVLGKWDSGKFGGDGDIDEVDYDTVNPAIKTALVQKAKDTILLQYAEIQILATELNVPLP